MEENPDNQMEMDVSSTTQDIPVIQEVSGPSSTVEVTIEVAETTVQVEEIKEDDQDHSIDSNTPESKPSSPQVQKTSSDTETAMDKPVQANSSKAETSPVKIIVPQSPTKPVNRRNIISVQASSADSQSSNAAEKSIIPVVKPVQTGPSKNESTIVKKTETQTATKPIIKRSTPVKLVHASSADSLSSYIVAVSTINDKVVQKTPEKPNVVKKALDTQFQNTPEKTTVKEIVVEKTPTKQKVVENPPVKALDTQVQNTPEKTLVKEIVVEKTPTKQKVVENPPVKALDTRFQNTPEKTLVKEIVVEKTPTKQKVVENQLVKEVTVVKETTIEKDPVMKNIIETKPVKETANLKSLEKSPVIENDTENVPVKETTVKSPIKEKHPLGEKSTEKTPAKVKTVENTLDEEKTSVKSPIKESSPENTLVETTPFDSSLDNKPENVDTSRDEVIVVIPVEFDDDDSQADTLTSATSESSEKERKSLNREMKSLIKSAKESKIISECTQIKTKIRKSRTTLDTSNCSLNASADAERIGSRRDSSNSQKSSCSEQSEKTNLKRSMRSQNPEFVIKNKQFLNTLTNKKEDEVPQDPADGKSVESSKKANQSESPANTPSKKKKTAEEAPSMSKPSKLRSDPYCWRCHWEIERAANDKAQVHQPIHCTVCPRSFHFKCLSGAERIKVSSEKNWVCPKCLTVLMAESSETRSPMMKKITLGMLCDLLKYALQRMMELKGVEPFMSPVDRTVFPDYDKYVVHAVDLSLMQERIAQGVYGSTEAFVSDAQWILHNSIIFNTHVKSLRTGSVLVQAKLTQAAKWLVRSCRAEMGEIEACPECYAAAHARRPTWFTDVCSTPHILLWAKLKGFPYWPAKGMSVNTSGMVDVRFFGAHDRAWVPARDCFLYSEKDPNNFKAKRQDIIDAMQEAENHIRNITRKFGKFIYPAYKVQFEPNKANEQLKAMIPSFVPEDTSPQKTKVNASPRNTKKSRRSTSKSSKDSYNEGEESESESEEETEPAEKKAKKAVKVDKQSDDKRKENKDGNKSMEVDANTDKKEKSNAEKHKESLRKRRRSCLEEAVITVMSPTSGKRKRLASADMTDIEKSKTESNQKKAENRAKDGKETSKNKSDEKVLVTNTKATPKKAAEETEKVVPRTTRASTPGSNLKQGNNKQTPRVDSPKVNTPKEADKVKKAKSVQREKSSSSEKSLDEKPKNKANKSLTNISKSEKNDATPSSSKEKSKGSESDSNKSDKITSTPKSKSAKGAKAALDDDNTSLAVLAKKSVNSEPCFPTISNVRSLSQTDFTKAKSPKSTEVTEANSNSSIFTPTSTDNVNNMKDAVAKLQKLRDQPAVVGRVGVRAFARMTSPPAEKQKTAESDKVEIEVKAEPMDYDDAERQSEKMDLLNTIRLRPVNPQNFPSLRDVRINKVTAGPTVIPQIRKPILVKPSDVRPRARKTFPQPQKSNDGRSELNSKNSMVYIPIQPPMTQAPRQPLRNNSSVNGPTSTPPALRPQITVNASSSNNIVNTVTTPLMTVVSMPSSLANATPTMPTITQMPSMGNIATVGQVGNMGAIGNIGAVGNMGSVGNMGAVSSMGTVGTVGGVHTVPLITSVNGQWTFSLQPMMSVGGVDTSPPPTVNGVVEPSLAPLSNTSNSASSLESISSPLPNRTSSDNNPPGEPPRLQQKPTLMNPFDPNVPVSDVPVASSAGPITAKLNQNAAKLADFFRNLLEDSIEKLSPDNAATQLAQAKIQLEQMHWKHKHEIDEIKHNHQLVLSEMRTAFEKEKNRLMQEQRRVSQAELNNAVKNAKSRQWCANCQQEAQFYCCWNTSYCDYPCQRAHWTQHFSVCTQQRTQDNSNGDDNSVDLTDDRLQPPENPPALQKTTGPVAMTVGGKLVPSRLYTQTNSSASKATPSIIVSMVEDTGGNPTVKCVGTYKPPNTPQAPSLLINKQILNNEENAAKKVVTSGGYLIVGASAGGNQSLVIN